MLGFVPLSNLRSAGMLGFVPHPNLRAATVVRTRPEGDDLQLRSAEASSESAQTWAGFR